MVLDNSELVATANTPPADGTKMIAVSAAIGGGVGASIAINAGSAVGAAAVGIGAAYLGGLAASYVAGREVGTAIGETELVRDALVDMMEAIWPIEYELPAPIIRYDEPWENSGGFSVSFGEESFEIQFYVDALGTEGASMDSNFNSGLEFYNNPFDAIKAAEELQLIGQPDYWINTCNQGGILP